MVERLLVTTAAIAALAIAGCGGASDESEPPPKATVELRDDGYHPSRAKIPVGGRITWVNVSDDAGTAQTSGVPEVELDLRKLDAKNLFDTHTLQPGEAETVAFDTPGEYEYFSSFDVGATGIIEVVDER